MAGYEAVRLTQQMRAPARQMCLLNTAVLG